MLRAWVLNGTIPISRCVRFISREKLRAWWNDVLTKYMSRSCQK